MIKLTQLGGEPFILNADLIRFVEQRPDTFITLTTNRSLTCSRLGVFRSQRKKRLRSATRQTLLRYAGRR